MDEKDVHAREGARPREETGAREEAGPRGFPVRILVVVLGLASLFVLVRVLEVDVLLERVQSWVRERGSWAPIAFVAIYVIATVLAVPGTALSVVAGPVFGTFFGTLWISIGSTIGAALCFLIARHLAGERFRESMRRNARFRKLDDMTERQGHVIVALTRLVPLFPFNVLNYGFGLTKVPFWTYVVWSWACMLPGTLLYVSGADVLAQFATGDVRLETLVVLMLALVLVACLVRSARRRLRTERTNPTEDAGTI